MIEHVEELGAKLRAVSLRELEGLEYREIHVLEARVAEDVPAHRAKGSLPGRNHHRLAGHVAAALSQGAEVGSDCQTLLSHCGGQVRTAAGNDRLPIAIAAWHRLPGWVT